MRFGKLILLLIFSLSFAVGLSVFAADTTMVGAEFKIIIPVSLVSESGFTGVVVQPPISNRFNEPNFYFRAKEKVDVGKGWGDAGNLISVLVQRINDESWTFNKGQEQILDLGSRYQYNTGSAGYYISVTGPDLQKVSTLAKKIKVLY